MKKNTKGFSNFVYIVSTVGTRKCCFVLTYRSASKRNQESIVITTYYNISMKCVLTM